MKSRLKFIECIQGIKFPMYISKLRVTITKSDEYPYPLHAWILKVPYMSICMNSKHSMVSMAS